MMLFVFLFFCFYEDLFCSMGFIFAVWMNRKCNLDLALRRSLMGMTVSCSTVFDTNIFHLQLGCDKGWPKKKSNELPFADFSCFSIHYLDYKQARPGNSMCHQHLYKRAGDVF